jgi:hypothetical protein
MNEESNEVSSFATLLKISEMNETMMFRADSADFLRLFRVGEHRTTWASLLMILSWLLDFRKRLQSSIRLLAPNASVKTKAELQSGQIGVV